MDRLRRALSSGWFLAGTGTLALALRVGHILALRSLPLFTRPILDSAYYDAWARQIAAGDWWGGPGAFFYDPLYTYLLAILYRTVGLDLLLPRLIQAVLGAATCVLVGLIGRRVSGPRVGNVAALLLAVYRPAIFQDGELEKSSLGLFLAAAALLAALGTTLRSRALAGAGLGLASLARGNLLLLMPLGALYFLAERPRWSRRSAQGAALFVVGFFLVLAPVAWRNHRASGEWILTTAGAGTNFYTGNNPANATGGFQTVPFVRPQSEHEEADFRAEAERRTGRRLGPGELSRYWFGEALRHVAERPGFAAGVFGKKVLLVVGDLELPDSWDIAFLKRYSPVLWIPVGLGWILPFAVVGALAHRRERGVLLLAGYVVVYGAAVAAFFVFARYRLHLVVGLAPLAALGLVHLAEKRRVRDGMTALAVALVSFLAPPAMGLSGAPSIQSFLHLAEMYQEQGDFERAGALLREAAAREPGSARTHCGLGKLALRQGRPAEARGPIATCLSIDPRYPDGWYLSGLARMALGDPAGAAGDFARQLAAVPGHVPAEGRLAEALLRQGRAADAAERYAALSRRGADGPDLRLAWAVALQEAGREEEAAAVLRQARTRGWPSGEEDVARARQALLGNQQRPDF